MPQLNSNRTAPSVTAGSDRTAKQSPWDRRTATSEIHEAPDLADVGEPFDAESDSVGRAASAATLLEVQPRLALDLSRCSKLPHSVLAGGRVRAACPAAVAYRHSM
jgi:hypothetical protein